jgi:hypothetical protein
MKRTIVGKLVRKAELLYPNRMQITVSVRRTIIDGHEFTISDLRTFEVGTYGIARCPFKEVLYNMSVGDELTVEFEKVDGKLTVVNMSNTPNLGGTMEDWFDTLEKDAEYWRSKGAKM